MIIELMVLLSIGFIVGLSGAMIPGPLLAYTLFDTTRKGRVTGHLIIVGHAIWEVFVILAVFIGIGKFLLSYKPIVYLIGGFVLVLMGLQIAKSKDNEVEIKESRLNSSVLGGIFYTLFNPTHPIWWATAGLALLLKGFEVLGIVGVIVVVIGHWFADFAYYAFVSFLIYKHKRYIYKRKRLISLILGLFVAILGAYFILYVMI
jgi:threonine/homoserine/homoserine lactone efflux protein